MTVAAHGNVKRWTSRGDATYTDQGPIRVIRPCEGMYLHPKGSAVAVRYVGIVRTNDVVCLLTAGWNFVGNPWPVERHPAPDQSGVDPDIVTTVPDLGLTVANGSSGSLGRKTADKIQLWNADVPANLGAEGYTGYYLLNGDFTSLGLGNRSHWTGIGSATLGDDNSTTVLKSGRGMFLRMQSAVDDWTIPAPQ